MNTCFFSSKIESLVSTPYYQIDGDGENDDNID